MSLAGRTVSRALLLLAAVLLAGSAVSLWRTQRALDRTERLVEELGAWEANLMPMVAPAQPPPVVTGSNTSR